MPEGDIFDNHLASHPVSIGFIQDTMQEYQTIPILRDNARMWHLWLPPALLSHFSGLKRENKALV